MVWDFMFGGEQGSQWSTNSLTVLNYYLMVQDEDPEGFSLLLLITSGNDLRQPLWSQFT